ncbi:MAG: hypothetical protein JKY42_06110 [Flavobacteriales bacterium]|nr:hypothetical protein [Flavobacteriales bacterium]
MDPSLQHKIFEVGPCLSKEKLLNYHSGSLSPHESNAVEKHLLSCQMCMDAMEGIALSTNPISSIGEIDTKIKILTGTVAAESFLNWRSGMAIAASLTGVLLGVFWLLKDIAPEQEIAENKTQTEESVPEEKERELDKQENPKVSEVLSDSISSFKIDNSIVSGTTSSFSSAPESDNIELIEVKSQEIRYLAKNNEGAGVAISEDANLAQATEIGFILEETNQAVTAHDESVAKESMTLSWSDSIDIAMEKSSDNFGYHFSTEKQEDADASISPRTNGLFAEVKTDTRKSNNLPTSYMNDLLIVDYGDIYSEDDESSSYDKEDGNDDVMAEKSLLSRSTSAAFENEEAATKKAEEDRLAATEITETQYTYENILQEGLDLYKQGSYSRAIAQFDFILQKYPEDHNALFYTGLSYFGIKKYNKAIEKFDVVYGLDKTPFKEDAEWQKALVLKEKGDTQKAKNLFDKIVTEAGYYADFSKTELEKL